MIQWSKAIVILILLCMFTRCSSDQSQRTKIIQWAKQIVSLEKRSEIEIELFATLLNNVKKSPPNIQDIEFCTEITRSLSRLYDEMISIDPPQEVADIHKNYSNSYESYLNVTRYFNLTMATYDILFYEKCQNYVIEADKYRTYGYNGFRKILDKYNISCEEIDYCEYQKDK